MRCSIEPRDYLLTAIEFYLLLKIWVKRLAKI